MARYLEDDHPAGLGAALGAALGLAAAAVAARAARRGSLRLDDFQGLAAAFGFSSPRKTRKASPRSSRSKGRKPAPGPANLVAIKPADVQALAVLGFSAWPTPDQLRARFRQLMLVHHPDRGGSTAAAAAVIAAHRHVAGRIPTT